MISFHVFLLGLSTDGWALAALALSATMMGADAWLTNRALKRSFSEGNPMIRWLMEKYGVLISLVGSKALALLISLVAAWGVQASGSSHWFVIAALGALGIIHVPVVIWNYMKVM